MDSDDDLYDEFGNYIGPDEEVNEEVSTDNGAIVMHADNEQEHKMVDTMEVDRDAASDSGAIVLHEDRQIYQPANEIYGNGVEILVQERDSQLISEPLIKPLDTTKINVEEATLPEVTYSRQYQLDLLTMPERTRNFAIVGQINHGKTALVDMLLMETHPNIHPFDKKRQDSQLRYSDTLVLEQQLGISLQMCPISLLLQDSKEKSYACNIIDTPGHVNFADEVVVAARYVDGFILVIDAVEAFSSSINSKRILEFAIGHQLPVILVINKLDRLILELRISPTDAFHQLRSLIDDVNDYAHSLNPAFVPFSPVQGNVVFASALYQWCFTIPSFATRYAKKSRSEIDPEVLATALWGNTFYDNAKKAFTKTSLGNVPTFVHFILNPLYKLYSHAASDDTKQLSSFLKEMSISFPQYVLKLDVKPLLRIVCSAFFGSSAPLVDAIANNFPSSLDGNMRIVERYSANVETLKSLITDNQSFVADVCKTFNFGSGNEFHVLAKIVTGKISVGDKVNVLTTEQGQPLISTVSDILLPVARYNIKIETASAGNIVLLKGIEMSGLKRVTLVSESEESRVTAFCPIDFLNAPVFKIAIEPVVPSELPQMVEAMRNLVRIYSLLQMKVEYSGEHILLGSGELYMECAMSDLRTMAKMEIKVSDPSTRFAESCNEPSSFQCFAKSPNGLIKFMVIAEPMDRKIVEDIANNKINLDRPVKEVAAHFMSSYGWDLLAARSVWSLGPSEARENILVDDTLSSNVNKKQLQNLKPYIIQGFQWAVREGPLCEEPIKNVLFKIVDAELPEDHSKAGAGQIIPAIRRACNSALLFSSVKLLEPVYNCYAICRKEGLNVFAALIEKRRGAVISRSEIASTPFHYIEGSLPVIDSFGFETDLRIASNGQISVSLISSGWQEAPGDPLDKDVVVEPLQAAKGKELARDFVLKTRRRKGIHGALSVATFLDEDIINSLVDTGLL